MRPSPSFTQIQSDLGSENQETRGRAMQNLLTRSKKDRSEHTAALPLFQTMLTTAPDSWTVTTAARGIELIQGRAEGRKAWLTLMNHPRDEIAAGAILSIAATDYLPELRQLLVTRTQPRIQFAIIRSLGRTKDPQFLSTIVPFLSQPELRVQAIIALQELEDPRALPSLEPLIQDTSDSGMTDDRGCTLRICDLASDASRRLHYVSGKKDFPPPAPPGKSSSPAGLETTRPPSLPAVTPPANSAPKKFRLPPNLFPYIPLIAALMEIPWVAALVIMQLSLTGVVARTRVQTHFLDALALLPPLIGLASALLVAVRRPTLRRVEIIILSLGSILCGLAALVFGRELFH